MKFRQLTSKELERVDEISAKRSGRWRARLRMLGRSYGLGLYDSREGAIQCVEQARSEIAKRAKRGISS